MSSCAANALECEGVLYLCDTVRDIVLVSIDSFRVWIAWKVCEFSESVIELVRLVIGSWSPLELIATCFFLEL